VNARSLPLTIKGAACLSLLGLLGFGFQVWQGLPNPVQWIPAEPRTVHAALLLPPMLAGESMPDVAHASPTDWTEHRMRGVDNSGRSVFFRVMVLEPKYRWQPGSTTVVMEGDQEAPLAKFPMKHGLAEELSSSRAVLALGTDEETHDDEPLSTARARNLARWFHQSAGGNAPVYGVDVGRYGTESEPPEGQTGRLVIAGVLVLDPGADLAAALRNALAENEDAPLNVRLYSRFELLSLNGETAVQ